MILPKQVLTSDTSFLATSSEEIACTVDESAITNSLDDFALATSSSKNLADLILWHERLGHVNIDSLHKMNNNGSLSDFKLDKLVPFQHPCEGYMLGKQHKSSYHSDPNKQRSQLPSQLIHRDVFGKQVSASLKGSLYYILYKDDATAYRFVHFSEHKFDAFPFFKQVVKIVKKEIGQDVLAIKTDQDREFLNTNFDKYLEENNISRQLSTIYTPQQNGYIERDNRIVMKMARSLIYAKDLPLKLWAEAVNTAVYILNRTINHQLGNITPYECWFGEKPSVQHLRIFGSLAWVFINRQARSKLDPKSLRAYFVRYSLTSRAYRFWNPVTDKILESNDYTVDEQSGKYHAGFPPDPSCDTYVTFPIEPILPIIVPQLIIPPPPSIDEITETLDGAVGVSLDSETLSQLSNSILAPVGQDASLQDIILQDEPHDCRFQSIQEFAQ